MESLLLKNDLMYSEERDDFFFYDPSFEEIITKTKKSGFQIKTFNELCYKIFKGVFDMNSSLYKEEGIPFIRISDIQNNTIDLSECIYISEETHKKEIKTELVPGDLVFSKVGTIDRLAIIPNNIPKCNISQNNVGARLRRDVILPEYALAFLTSKYGLQQIIHSSMTHVQPKLILEELKKIIISLPPIEKQKQISLLLQSAYFLRKQKLKQAEEELGKIDDYVLKELGISLSKIEDEKSFIISSLEMNERDDYGYYDKRVNNMIKEIINGLYSFISLGDEITDILYGASLKNDYFDDGIHFLRINNLKPNKIDLSEVVYLNKNMKKELRNAFVKEGDLLMSRSGTVGVVACVPKEVEGFAFGSYQIKFMLSKGISPQYVSFVLNSPIGTLQSRRNTTGAVQMNITIPGIKDIKIPLPPLEVQNKIVNEANKIVKESENLIQQANEVVDKSKNIIEKSIIGEELSKQEEDFANNVIKEAKKLGFIPQ